MSSRADKKRRRAIDRFPHITVIDDVCKPLTKEQQRRFVEYVLNDRPAFRVLERTQDVIAAPTDIFADSDPGRS